MQQLVILTSDAALERSLRGWCEAHLELAPGPADASFDAVDGDAIVITTAADCSPVECGDLTRRAGAVIVLAPIPSPAAERTYLAAGAAAYLPMSLDRRALEAAVHAHST